MTDFRLIKKVENGGIFIPLKEFENREVEIELHIKPLDEKGLKTAKAVADDFFSKMNHHFSVNFDELNVYEQ